jgi:hypothetical protein
LRSAIHRIFSGTYTGMGAPPDMIAGSTLGQKNQRSQMLESQRSSSLVVKAFACARRDTFALI